MAAGAKVEEREGGKKGEVRGSQEERAAEDVETGGTKGNKKDKGGGVGSWAVGIRRC
jgi:hypothetical protein